MKTITKTIEIPDKFIISGNVASYQATYDYGPQFIVGFIDENGQTFELPVNADFLNKVAKNKYKIEMEIKFIERK